MAYGSGYATGYADATGLSRLLEIEFDSGTWTDVTADLVELTTRRGRNRELGAFETGNMAFTLRNDTRKYDPDHTTGPYYGKLRPNRRVRWQAVYSGTTYPVFLGYIDSIGQVYGGPNDATAEFSVSDWFKLLNRVELPASVWAAEIGVDNPTNWWRLGEPSGSTTVTGSVAGVQLASFGAPGLGSAGLVTRDPDGAMTNADATSGFAGTGTFVAAGAVPFTFEAIISTADTDGTIVSFGNAGEGMRARLTVVGGKAVFEVGKTVAGNTTSATAGGTATVNDGHPHHMVGVYTAGAFPDMALYVDGVAAGTGDLPASSFGARQEMVIGNNGSGWGIADRSDGLVGTIDEVVLYAGATVSSARIAAHSTARATPWRGDLPGARLGRVFDLAGVAAGDRNIDTGSASLQSTDLGWGALTYAQKVEETELGRLFVAKDGKLRFIGRRESQTGGYLTSQATVVDADSGAGLGYMTTSADVDEATIVTRATVSRQDGVAVTVTDAAAVAEFKLIDQVADGLLHDSETYSQAYAQWLLNTQKTPASRIGQVTLELFADPTNLFPSILALEIGDQITYKRKPQNTGATISLAMRVEAISHATGAGYWKTSLQLTPFNPAGGYQVGVWDTSLWDQAVWGI